jgi:hypothetical protein
MCRAITLFAASVAGNVAFRSCSIIDGGGSAINGRRDEAGKMYVGGGKQDGDVEKVEDE